MTMGERLRGLREDKDMRQAAVAALLKTSQSYYAQYENDHRPLPIAHIKMLATFYAVSADYLLRLPKGLRYPQY